MFDRPIFHTDYKPNYYHGLLHEVTYPPSNHIRVRGMDTVERINAYIQTPFNHIQERIHFNRGRWENPIFGYAEGLFILLGIEEVAPYAWYAPQMAHFADEGADHFHGAYGPRLGTNHILGSTDDLTANDWVSSNARNHLCAKNQLKEVYEKLKNDPTTRQAIMTIWNPELDNTRHRDIPCTIMFHFLLRNQYLHLNVYMRSQDMMTGFVYDTQQFKWFQEIVAGWLSKDLGPVSPGNYAHILGSAHIYEKDLDVAKQIIESQNPREYIYNHYHTYTAGLHYEEWKKTFKILAEIENLSRTGKVNEALNKLRLAKWRVNANTFYYEMASAFVAVNMAKFGLTIDALSVAERITGELTIPTLCRIAAYHRQKTNEYMDLKRKLHPDMMSLVKAYVYDKAGTLKMVD